MNTEATSMEDTILIKVLADIQFEVFYKQFFFHHQEGRP